MFSVISTLFITLSLAQSAGSFPRWCDDIFGPRHCRTDAFAERAGTLLDRLANEPLHSFLPPPFAEHVIRCQVARQTGTIGEAPYQSCREGLKPLGIQSLLLIPARRARVAAMPPSGARVVVECDGKQHLQITARSMPALKRVLFSALENLGPALTVARERRHGAPLIAGAAEVLPRESSRSRLIQTFRVEREARWLTATVWASTEGVGTLPINYAGESCGARTNGQLVSEAHRLRALNALRAQLSEIGIPTTFTLADYLRLRDLYKLWGELCIPYMSTDTREEMAMCASKIDAIDAYARAFARQFRLVQEFESQLAAREEIDSFEYETHDLNSMAIDAHERGEITPQLRRRLEHSIERCRLDVCGCTRSGLFNSLGSIINTGLTAVYPHDETRSAPGLINSDEDPLLRLAAQLKEYRQSILDSSIDPANFLISCSDDESIPITSVVIIEAHQSGANARGGSGTTPSRASDPALDPRGI